jgi:hypothetical protein
MTSPSNSIYQLYLFMYLYSSPCAQKPPFEIRCMYLLFLPLTYLILCWPVGSQPISICFVTCLILTDIFKIYLYYYKPFMLANCLSQWANYVIVIAGNKEHLSIAEFDMRVITSQYMNLLAWCIIVVSLAPLVGQVSVTLLIYCVAWDGSMWQNRVEVEVGTQ